MIAKARIPKTTHPKFSQLAQYLLKSKGDEERSGKRVEHIIISNCASEEMSTALQEIELVQKMNKSAGSGHTYHLVVSLQKGEKISHLDQIHSIERSLAEGLGYGEHQRIAVLHTDTDCPHLHVAINTIHPETLKKHRPFRDHFTLQKLCKELVLKHNLKEIDQNAYTTTPSQDNIEIRSGFESFKSWLVREAKDDVFKALPSVQTWDMLHQVLHEKGLWLEKKGNGLVLLTKNSLGRVIGAKASDLDRTFSYPALSARFGEFVPCPDSFKSARSSYQKVPSNPTERNSPLFETYRTAMKERMEHKKLVSEGFRLWKTQQSALLKQSQEREFKRLKEKSYTNKEARQKAYTAFKKETRKERLEQREAFKKERERLAQTYRYLTWNDYLIERSNEGDAEAIKTLRRREAKRERLCELVMTSEHPEETFSVVERTLKPVTRLNGDQVYYTGDSGVVRDRASEILVESPKAVSVLVGLKLAEKKFQGKTIVLEGSKEFVDLVSLLAKKHALGMTIKANGTVIHTREEPWIRSYLREKEKEGKTYQLLGEKEGGEFVYLGQERGDENRRYLLLERGGTLFVKEVSRKDSIDFYNKRKGETISFSEKGQVQSRGRGIR